jgi:hypothetical protein
MRTKYEDVENCVFVTTAVNTHPHLVKMTMDHFLQYMDEENLIRDAEVTTIADAASGRRKAEAVAQKAIIEARREKEARGVVETENSLLREELADMKARLLELERQKL